MKSILTIFSKIVVLLIVTVAAIAVTVWFAQNELGNPGTTTEINQYTANVQPSAIAGRA